jgi:uncharacterized RDD family membrane protein YckC
MADVACTRWPIATMSEPAPDSKPVFYAGFWIRSWASAIDVILLLVVTTPLLLWIYGIEYFAAESPVGSRGVMDFLIQYVIPTVVVIVFWKYKSATPGKMVVSAKIVDARTGGKPTLVQFLIRYFAYIVSMLPLGLGFFWIAFDPKKQAWHDKLAGTVVVREKKGTRESR